MSDLDDFYAEQERRMNLPDEDIDDYLRRLRYHKKSGTHARASVYTPVIDKKIDEHQQNYTQRKDDHTRHNSGLLVADANMVTASRTTEPSPSSGNLKRKMLQPSQIKVSLEKRLKHKHEPTLENVLVTPSIQPAVISRNETSERGTVMNIPGTNSVWHSASKKDDNQTLHAGVSGQKPDARNRHVSSVRNLEHVAAHVKDIDSNNQCAQSAESPPVTVKETDIIKSVAKSKSGSYDHGEVSGKGIVKSVANTTTIRSPAPILGQVLQRPQPEVQGVSVISDHRFPADEGGKAIKAPTTSLAILTADSTHGLSEAPSLAFIPPSSSHSREVSTKEVTPADTLADFPVGRPSFVPNVTSTPLAPPRLSRSRFPPQATLKPTHEGSSTSNQCPKPNSPKRVTKASTVSNTSYITTPGTSSSDGLSRVSSVSDVSELSSSSILASDEKMKSIARGTCKASSASAVKSKVIKQSKKKEKSPLMTPLEYAQKLQSKLDLPNVRKMNYLRGKRIFYVGGDMQYASTKTRGRMDYIVKHGGTLLPLYNPEEVTHIVTDANTRPTLRALGLKSLAGIPDHIPTVKWSWVISGLGRLGINRVSGNTSKDKGKGKAIEKVVEDEVVEEVQMDYEFLHAAFPDRIDAGRSWQRLTSGSKMGKQALQKLQVKGKHPDNGKGKDADQFGGAGTQIDNSDLSRISAFTQDLKSSHPQGPLEILPAPPSNMSTSAKCHGSGNAEATTSTDRRPADEKKDPLAEFYPQAKAERDAAWQYEDSDIEDDDDEIFPPVENVRVKKGFTCDKKEVQRTECANQDIIHKLQELMELHKSKASDDDHWRVIGYAKCIRALRNYPRRIKSLNEARAIRGVGEKTALKIMEIIKTGDLRRIEYERTEDIEATTIFQGIYGVGRQIALMWYANGCRTLDDIKARKGGIKVSSVQDIGIQFYDDINARMPRAEAQQIFTLIKQQALALDSRLFIEIMGSFRRGKADCGDIDILLTRPVDDGKTHSGLLLNLLSSLHAVDILTEDLSFPDDFSSLELSYRGLCHLPEEGSRRRRIDILCVPWERRGAALLYFTGDDIFNRAIRLKANVLGYSLNQRGLYHGVVRDPRDRRIKVCEGTIIASETEEEIFKILGVPWQEPHERVRG